MAPKWLQKSTVAPKATLGCILLTFWLPFGTLYLTFGALWLPFGALGSLLVAFGSFWPPFCSLLVPFGYILVPFGFILFPFGFTVLPFRSSGSLLAPFSRHFHSFLNFQICSRCTVSDLQGTACAAGCRLRRR